jgi:hypothetical protein
MLVGAQMVNTMADHDLLLDYLLRTSAEHENTYCVHKPIENLDGMTVRDCIVWLRKERRTLLKR